MLKGFRNILVKELKELIRDPKILLGMILVPLLLFPILGLVMGYATQSAQEQAQKATILIVNNDGGNWSQIFVSSMNSSYNIATLNNMTPDEVLAKDLLSANNSTLLVEIPDSFSSNMTTHIGGDANITATLNVYGVFKVSSVFSEFEVSQIDNFVYGFNRYVSPDVIYTKKSTVIKGEIEDVDPAGLSTLMLSQTLALPITIMILLTFSMQIAATSVAMEKEEKTLETLLTLPVDRFAILMGKLSSSMVVSGVGALAYMIGYNFMLGSVVGNLQAGGPIDLVELGLVPSPLGYLLLGISLFVTLLSGLALAVIMSAFSEDVRGAQALVGYIYPIVFIPALALMYLDVNALPFALKAVFYAMPFSHPIIASKAVMTGDHLTIMFGILYVTAFTLLVMYIASRFFATEKILTAKLKFKGLRRLRKTPKE